jgi:hypothetical protein
MKHLQFCISTDVYPTGVIARELQQLSSPDGFYQPG